MADKEDDDNVDLGKLDDVFETSEVDDEEEDQGSEQEAATVETIATVTTSDKGEKNAATPAAEKDETANASESWTKTAYLEEKRKRQEAETELASYKKEKAPEQKQETPDVFVDPEAYTKHQDQKASQMADKTRVTLSREFMLELKPDYVAKEAKFIEMTQTNPALVSEMYASPNPAKFAYEKAVQALNYETKLKLADEIGDPVAYKEKLKAEILAELNPTSTKKPRFENTPSLATAPAVKADSVRSIDNVNDLFEDDD
jgi:hypothetical protein